MVKYKCADCGVIFDGSLSSCPKCGCPSSVCDVCQAETMQPFQPHSNPISKETEVQIEVNNTNVLPVDFAQYVYECGVLFWETITKRYAKFTGRASRIEFWSFWFIYLFCAPLAMFLVYLIFLIPTLFISVFFALIAWIIGFLIVLIPAIAVSIRRMHDINKCGWWSCCPIACFFLYLKRSDKSANEYGEPANYNHIFTKLWHNTIRYGEDSLGRKHIQISN